MRDDHLMQEKIEVSLERRHVALLAACALVLLGGVFALGVLVGRQLASAGLAGPLKPAAGDLSALDAQKDDPPSPRPPAARAPSAASSQTATIAASPVRSPPQPAASAVRNEPIDAAAPVAAGATRSAADAGAVVVVPPAKVASIPAGKPAAKPASQLALPPPPKHLGNYTVQLGASQDRAEAQRIEARARTSGLRPYLVEANLGAKGVWYRVRVGAFDTRAAADRFRRDVERELRASAAVMPSH
jgi:cell division septation protein DedD